MLEPTTTTAEGVTRKRGHWDNEVEFLLAVVGLTVGLGSVWRFPSLAYNNGGSAFLIPFLICAVLVGQPMMYLEMIIGQYTHAGPSVVFRHYAPALQGIGWTMAITSLTICMYYSVVVSWSGIYFVLYIIGRHKHWSSCDNEWNDM
ncbi:hypothetical protein GCK32_016675 [Trichostrongylus colubriformis]|uniref:Uncharacterized protein n=1 Tax=Trichostrongylus colubriformis TaxID=6319 RepID=A0AAN8FYG2_TRICO